MFHFSTDASYPWPVTVQEPHGGTFRESTFTGHFRRLPAGRVRELIQDLPPAEADLPVLREALVGWEGICRDPGGLDPLPFSPEARELLLEDAVVRLALGAAYIASLQGAEEKNSVTPPGAGRPPATATAPTGS